MNLPFITQCTPSLRFRGRKQALAKGAGFTGENVPVSLDSFGRQKSGILRSGQSGYASTDSRTALQANRLHKLQFGGDGAEQNLTLEQTLVLSLGNQASENLEAAKKILPPHLGGLNGIAATVNPDSFTSLIYVVQLIDQFSKNSQSPQAAKEIKATQAEIGQIAFGFKNWVEEKVPASFVKQDIHDRFLNDMANALEKFSTAIEGQDSQQCLNTAVGYLGTMNERIKRYLESPECQQLMENEKRLQSLR